MSSEDRSLPLFPLNMVLFPNATLPLQIFEERYKLMMKHCLEGDSKLGVVLIKAGAEVGGPATPHSTGTGPAAFPYQERDPEPAIHVGRG